MNIFLSQRSRINPLTDPFSFCPAHVFGGVKRSPSPVHMPHFETFSETDIDARCRVNKNKNFIGYRVQNEPFNRPIQAPAPAPM